MVSTVSLLAQYRGLLFTLVARELKARYRGSVLGYFWSLVNPLLLLSVYSFVFGSVFKPSRAELTDPYALFLVTGLFPWVWVSTSLLEGTESLTGNAGLLRKAVFPVEVLPMVPVLSSLVHFLFAVPILGAALLIGRWLGHPVSGPWAVMLPLVILLQMPLIAGLTLGLAALNVHFKDVRDLLANFLTLVFFLTPILYPLEFIPQAWQWLADVLRWANPFTPFTLAYQDVLFYNVAPASYLWLQMVVTSALFWFLGSWLIRRLRDSLVEAV